MIEKRPFGAGLRDVGVLGLGTVKFGRNTKVRYGGFDLPTDDEISRILDICIDHGITLLDTAPAYGMAEERLGKIMGARRDKFFVVSKTGEVFDGQDSKYIFTAEHTRKSVEQSLRNLKTDRIDCLLVHCSRDDYAVLTQTPVVETLRRLQEEGKIASIGASTYTVAGGRAAVDMCDAVMVAYNQSYRDEAEVIAQAHSKNRAVLVKKGIATIDGRVPEPAENAENIRFVLDTPGVTSLVFGSLKPANILSNINTLSKG